MKSCQKVIAKEGADGLLGLAIEHEDYPEGLGVVVKIAHGWDNTTTWFVARWILGVLGFELLNPYALDRQKGFIVSEVIPPDLRDKMAIFKLGIAGTWTVIVGSLIQKHTWRKLVILKIISMENLEMRLMENSWIFIVHLQVKFMLRWSHRRIKMLI